MLDILCPESPIEIILEWVIKSLYVLLKELCMFWSNKLIVLGKELLITTPNTLMWHDWSTIRLSSCSVVNCNCTIGIKSTQYNLHLISSILWQWFKSTNKFNILHVCWTTNKAKSYLIRFLLRLLKLWFFWINCVREHIDILVILLEYISEDWCCCGHIVSLFYMRKNLMCPTLSLCCNVHWMVLT